MSKFLQVRVCARIIRTTRDKVKIDSPENTVGLALEAAEMYSGRTISVTG